MQGEYYTLELDDRELVSVVMDKAARAAQLRSAVRVALAGRPADRPLASRLPAPISYPTRAPHVLLTLFRWLLAYAGSAGAHVYRADIGKHCVTA